jgi:hypothetical protein
MLYIFNGTTTPGGSGTLIIEISRSHSQQKETFISSAGFEPTVLESERPQTHALDLAVAGIVFWLLYRREVPS